MFLLPSRIEAFHDDGLFLKFIENLLRERNNFSFPENAREYDRYFEDCIRLKEQMRSAGDRTKTTADPSTGNTLPRSKDLSAGDTLPQSEGPSAGDTLPQSEDPSADNSFPEDIWLQCTISLFENLKTPFYSVYAQTMLGLEPCFKDRNLFLRTLQDFYSVIIKSTPENLQNIARIAKRASSYIIYLKQNEKLLADILRFQLACFTTEKNIWLVKLFNEMYTSKISSLDDIRIEGFLADFQKKELDFLCRLTTSQDGSQGGADLVPESLLREASPLSEMDFPEYLALRALDFSGLREHAPEEVFPGYRRHSGSSHLSSDSILNKYAYNMTAASYITNPAIGREAELNDLELILISPKKSPILLGEAGVGKTAVAEGLAWLLQRGQVPDLLKNREIYKLTTTSLLSGTKYVGEMEERIRQLMEELDRHPEIILFIDEIHTIVGAGSTESSNNDISNMLKPYIDRGDIKIIGSTTSDEYQKYILSDKALARRFYPVTVEEPDADTTLRILLGTIPAVEYETKVRNAFSQEVTIQILRTLIRLSSEDYQPQDKRTRRPELPLTLLEIAFSYAALQSRDTVSRDDFISAVRHSNLLKAEVKNSAEQYFL